MPESLPRLADDANELLERARGEARKRHHDEIRIVHLVAALLEIPIGLALLARRTVDVRQLRALIETHLASIPPAATYRDAPPETRIAPSVAGLLAKVSDSRTGLFFQGPVRAVDIAVGALGIASVAALVDEARFDVAPVEKLVDAAAQLARERGHANVLVDHALLAFFDVDPQFVPALRVLGHEPADVRARLDARLTGKLRSFLLAGLPSLVEFAASRATLAKRDLDLGPIVVDLLRHPSIRVALGDVGVNRYELLYAYVHHDVPLAPRLDRRGEPVNVVFHDDAYTTMEFVVQVMKEAFGLDDAVARRTMVAVHEHGSATVATLPRDRAMACLIRALGAARDQLMPLRMEIAQSVELSMTNR